MGLRTTAGGHMLDFRYRVIDAEKARSLHGPKVAPTLTDPDTGLVLKVPRPPKIGPMKQTRSAPIAGRTYVSLFANPARQVRPGDEMSLALGELRIDSIVVQ